MSFRSRRQKRLSEANTNRMNSLMDPNNKKINSKKDD